MAPSDSFFQQVFIEFCYVTDGRDTGIQRNGPCCRESCNLVEGHTNPLEYNINGDKDYQTNYLLAQDYFERITAPQKEMYIMKNMTHGLLESRSEEFSRIVHQIAKKAAPK